MIIILDNAPSRGIYHLYSAFIHFTFSLLHLLTHSLWCGVRINLIFDVERIVFVSCISLLSIEHRNNDSPIGSVETPDVIQFFIGQSKKAKPFRLCYFQVLEK